MSWFGGGSTGSNSGKPPVSSAARYAPANSANAVGAAGGAAFASRQPVSASASQYGPSNPARYGGASQQPLQAPMSSQHQQQYNSEPKLPPRQQSNAYASQHAQPQHISQGMYPSTESFTVVKSSDNIALANRIAFNSADFPRGSYVKIKRDFIFTVENEPSIPPGSMGVANHQRKWMSMASNDVEEVIAFDPRLGIGPDHLLSSITLDVGFLNEAKPSDKTLDSEAMEKEVRRVFDGCMFTVGQPVVFNFERIVLSATVKTLSLVELIAFEKGQTTGKQGRMGVLVGPQTSVLFQKADGSSIKLKSSSKRGPVNAIIQPDFKFEDMGIGGLDAEFATIFRRAFASRIFPPGLVEKLGIQHVKGILLYGPPGTGKTLMARQIGAMLNAREPKIVNGPEILNKFVGQSEENIRKLFADAEKEYKSKGDESGLHIIIFDELDAICKQRGSTGGGTGVGDSVVNQLLSKMDGVDQLNNILIIGMTNRLDMIDEALLRPGRLELKLEISLPDEAGRLQILKIHTSKMSNNGIMGNDVDVAELAALTKNFSGAEIGGLVKSATSFAFNRHVKVGTAAGISEDIDDLQICRQDFMMALDEVHPAFGVSEDELQQVIANGIIHFDGNIESILRDGSLYVEQVRKSDRTPCVSVLVHGPPGSGKSALAASIAMASDFPFIKLVSPENMVGFDEHRKVDYLNKVFLDSYKSALSVVVVDNIERILEWSPIGARFSNRVLQALMVLITKKPPRGRRLLVLATTSNNRILSEMELLDIFQADIHVQAISNLTALYRVVEELALFERLEDYQRFQQLIERAGWREDNAFVIGVKKLLSFIEMARQDDEPADRLIKELLSHAGQSGL